ncbi:MAG: type II CRISPR RNA-guided endonuclease Cas9 [Draconibacterium sp.]
MNKKLGIDLGSSSLGWFLREGDKTLKKGVIIFNSGMAKDKSGGYTSPTRDRRLARSRRRLIQSRKYRKWKLLDILIEHDCVPLEKTELENWSKYKKGKIRKFPENTLFQKWLACDFSYLENGRKYKNPYELRIKSIDSKLLSKHELGRALYHLIQRRGYKDIGEKDKETKTQIERREVGGFEAALQANRTIAEALSENFLKKNKRARNEYPYRAEYEKELIEILKVQEYNVGINENKEYVDEFVREVRKAIIWQRPLRSQKGNIGKCTFEPTKPRCPASHPIFEIFRAWQYINTIKTVNINEDKYLETENIPIEFKRKLFADVFLKQDKNFKFDKIQTYLDKLFSEKKHYNYYNKSTRKYDSSVSGMPVCKGLITIFGEKVKSEINQLHEYNIGTTSHKIVGRYSIYDLWHLIFETDDDHLEDFAINKLRVPTVEKTRKGEIYYENPVVRLKKSSFSSSYSNLSLKAMCKIIPFLHEGFLYNDAVLLAKMPDIIDNWKKNKDLIYKIVIDSNDLYQNNKVATLIANGLIDKYKSLPNDEIFAYKDYEYKITEYDKKDVLKACISYYGEITWKQEKNKEEIIEKVSGLYQNFFNDSARDYRKVPTLTNILKQQLEKEGIELKGSLYHHSDRSNLYPRPIYNKEFRKELLAVPLIDSIKNPMFNKAMSILRKLINELLIQEYVDNDGVIQSYIDENTEIIIEVARELYDNNKRIAIERFQRERRNQREKYREFIREVKGEDEKTIEKDISKLEMWTEQLTEEPFDNKRYQTKNQEILAEKDALKRYQLWMEQKGQCMYTGRTINISQLFSTDIEIEHTIPKSLLPDSTMANLTVCFAKYNSDIKNNRIPKECPNYSSSKDLPDVGMCSAIEPRLEKWENLRDHFKKLYSDNSKPFGNESEDSKNGRIQLKHYYKMHYEYWRDKVERFTSDEISESWVRRQLTDTQMVSKYAREYLKTYFKKVLVQKGSTTADFRKIFGIQGEEKKDRSKHTHHCIDAAVLTLIPINSSKRVELLAQLHREEENNKKITRKLPDGYQSFNSKALIDEIERETLIVNYVKDKITEPTYRNVRKRGKLQYLKDDHGKFVTNAKGDKILLKAKGVSVRGDLFKDTYLGKIRNVERNVENKPVRENGEWKYLTGEGEFIFAVRKSIVDANIDDIIDPDIQRIVRKQLNDGVDIRRIQDHQGNIIRHVRVKTKAGRRVKERINYRSKYEYKNSYYSSAGTVPYAILISNLVGGRVDRIMIPIPIHEVAQTFKEFHGFNAELYLKKFHPDINEYRDLKLLKVGQKVIVLNSDSEFDQRKDIGFQMRRMYKITQFSEGNIWLKYHLEAKETNEIKDYIKGLKSDIVQEIEDNNGLPRIIEDENISDVRRWRKDYEDKMFKFSSLNDYRLFRLQKLIGEEETKKIKEKLDKYKAFSAIIELEGETPLMKTSKNNWNFLYENYDFEMDITGDINWVE